MAQRAQTLQQDSLTHSLKKLPGAKKRKKPDSAAATVGATAAVSAIRNSATASLTSKVLLERDERNKRTKLDRNANLRTLLSSTEQNNQTNKTNDFMSRGFTIPAGAKR